MSPRLLSALVVSGLLSCSFAQNSVAATTATIDLTTDQGKPCTVTTTDPLGLHLEQNGTHFVANPATLTGEGCGTGTGGSNANPPTTPFILSSNPNPLEIGVGQQFTVTWTLAGGATPITCTGSISDAPAGVTLAAWTAAAAGTVGQNTRTITPTAADIGNSTTAVSFNLKMTCTNASGSIASSPLAIKISPVAVPPTDSCPAGRLTKAPSVYANSYGLCYKSPNGVCTTDGGADNLATFPIWIGRHRGSTGITPAAPPYKEFPGESSSGPSFQIKAGQYVSALFTVPNDITVLNGTIVKAAGNIQGSGWIASNADISISKTCGDFSAAGMVGQCTDTNVPNDGTAVRWIIDQPSAGRCTLVRGQPYYLNVRTNGCADNTWCTLRIDN